VNSPHLLLPLRFPELGPSLGKLVSGTGRGRGTGYLPIDDVRYHLVNRIIRCAGEARRLAASGERDAALAALGRDAWLLAWEDAVTAVADRLVDEVESRLEAEGRSVRMPARLRREIALEPAERRAVGARLGSTGADLIAALDRVDATGAAVAGATGLERPALDAWQSALTHAARQLEAAWLRLEDAVDREMARWRAVGERVSRWRRPRWPVVLTAAVAVPLAVWVGLAIGGAVGVPAWLAPVLDLVGF